MAPYFEVVGRQRIKGLECAKEDRERAFSSVMDALVDFANDMRLKSLLKNLSQFIIEKEAYNSILFGCCFLYSGGSPEPILAFPFYYDSFIATYLFLQPKENSRGLSVRNKLFDVVPDLKDTVGNCITESFPNSSQLGEGYAIEVLRGAHLFEDLLKSSTDNILNT